MSGTKMPARLIVMGVAGCGKSTIGAALAEAVGARFLDGDDFHPPANVAKMSAGQALTDDDRWPWLDRLGIEMEAAVAETGTAVLACSALKRVYRERLTAACAEPPMFVHLDGDRELIEARMAARQDHFMPVGLLDSQFATLERIADDENAIVISIDAPAPTVIERIRKTMATRAD
ncbi:MAG: gluconokinase [Pseudomonadota bacterium]